MPKSLKYILKKMNKILINLPSTEILRTNIGFWQYGFKYLLYPPNSLIVLLLFQYIF